jgi:deoxycytidylate deaminase
MAIKLAQANDFHDQWRLGAVLSRSGSVLSFGLNKPKNDPAFMTDYLACSVHAEEDALAKVTAQKAKGSILYVARITRAGKIAVAKPCARCQVQIIDAGIKKVLYTISKDTYGIWNTQKGIDE